MPFAGYVDHEDCVQKNGDKGDPDAYCATIERKVKKGYRVLETSQTLSPAGVQLTPQGELIVPITRGNYWYGDEVAVIDPAGSSIDAVVTGFLTEGLRVKPLT